MTADAKAMLNRVVTDVFNGEFVVKEVTSDNPTLLHDVEVVSRAREGRAVKIRADGMWIEAFIPELGFRAALVDEDNDDEYRQEELSKLCRALRAYLEGGGQVRYRRRSFGRGSTPELVIEVGGFEWRFGKRSWMWAREV